MAESRKRQSRATRNNDDTSKAPTEAEADRRASRFNAAFPAWLALTSAVVAGVIGSVTTLIGTRITVTANESSHNKERQEHLEDTQRSERKDAYEKFLTAAQRAVLFERGFWCDSGTEVPTMSGGKTPDYHACPNVRGGQSVVDDMNSYVAVVALYAGDDTRKAAYDLVTNTAFLIEQYGKLGTSLKASSLSDNPAAVRWQIESAFFGLTTDMCREQSVLPNKCETPRLK